MVITENEFMELIKPLKVLDFPVRERELLTEYYNRIKSFSINIVRNAIKNMVDNETQFPKPSIFLKYIFQARDEYANNFTAKVKINVDYVICQCKTRYAVNLDREFELVCRVCKKIYHVNYLRKCFNTQTELTNGYLLETYLEYPNPNDMLLQELKNKGIVDKYHRPVNGVEYGF